MQENSKYIIFHLHYKSMSTISFIEYKRNESKQVLDFSITIMPYHDTIYFGEIFCWNAFLVKLALIYLQKNGDLQYHGEIISISAGLSVSHMFFNVL